MTVPCGPKRAKFLLLLNHRPKRKTVDVCSDLNSQMRLRLFTCSTALLFLLTYAAVKFVVCVSSLLDCQPREDRLHLFSSCIPRAKHSAWPIADAHLKSVNCRNLEIKD